MSTKVNKSEVIRQVAAENPQLAGQPTAIARLCQSQHNITVTAAAVNQAMRKKGTTVPKAVATPQSARKPAKAVAKTAKSTVLKKVAAKSAASKSASVKRSASKRVASVAKSTVAASGNNTVGTIAAARSFIDLAGGIEGARQVLDAMAG